MIPERGTGGGNTETNQRPNKTVSMRISRRRGRKKRKRRRRREIGAGGGGRSGIGRREVEREEGERDEGGRRWEEECLCLDSASHSISFLAVSGEQRSDKPHHSTSPWLGVRDPPVS